MRRHVIIGRFGVGDTEGVPTANDEVVTQLDLVASKRRLDHGLGPAIDDLRSVAFFPTEVGLDLAVTATLVHLADMRISRGTESQDSWTREIRLVVPVSDPARWGGVTSLLERMLNFLTGDRWIIGVRSRPAGFKRILPRAQVDGSSLAHDAISLFSGGLDSLIGTIDLLESGRTPLLVSHAGEGATSAAQNVCFDGLKKKYSERQLDRLRVWMTFPEGAVKGVAPENTTRGRSFLFIALGIFAGTGTGAPFTLHVPENGLIALNVPLDVLRLGSLSTRTTHPFYMHRWNELLQGLGIAAQVSNPYWNQTKGEMVAGCAAPALLKRLSPTSLSCSSPTKGRWEGRGIQHCGYCLPCIIRRAALHSAWGAGGDKTVYTVPDLEAHTLDTLQAEGQQVRSCQFAIDRLKSRAGIEHLLIHKPGPLTDELNHLSEFAAVYRRGMNEVSALLAGVRTMPR